MRHAWMMLLALCATLNTANAQEAAPVADAFDFELFRPPADSYGYLGVPSAATLGHLQLGLGFWTQYENDPMILVFQDQRYAPVLAQVEGDNGEGIVDDRLSGNVQAGMGISRYFSLTFDLPIVFWQDGYKLGNIANPRVAPTRLELSGVGDLRLIPKIVALDRDRVPIGLALEVPVSLPTGGTDSFMGEAAYTVTPSTVIEFSDGKIKSRQYTFRSAVTAGFRMRSPARVRDVDVLNGLVYGIAMGLHPAPALEIVGEFRGAAWGTHASQQPAEALGGLKFLAGDYVSVNIGGGMGVLPGLGSPDWRLLGGVAVAPNFDPNARDTDKDGIVDAMDRCPKEAEDLDAFQDEDGCPERDNDVDGIPDEQDRCPMDAEDQDAWQDADGCPDPDNDKDRIPDISDRCPNEAETENGHLDDDGCPDQAPVLDTDGDSYNDDVDRCPYDPEDGAGDEPYDGCPNLRVVIEKNFIKITEQIYFDFALVTIQERSFSLLDEIASTIVDNPQIKKIRVEGHTDDVGSDTANLKLSQGRADAVVAALASRGVDADRFDGVGFGEMRPIDSNETDEGRANNRRVEFIIIDQE